MYTSLPVCGLTYITPSLVGKWTWEQVLGSTKLVNDEVRGRGEANRGLSHVVLVHAVGGELLDELGRELSFDGVGDQAAYDRQELEGVMGSIERR